jgi:hypothetical protein
MCCEAARQAAVIEHATVPERQMLHQQTAQHRKDRVESLVASAGTKFTQDLDSRHKKLPEE